VFTERCKMLDPDPVPVNSCWVSSCLLVYKVCYCYLFIMVFNLT
jgi:hypothetical protein